ncbi:hypothetical protein L7F22_012600 [Adiantum nelumboides]|nr:hypothetical protein [Adiantum nelumboides]
MEQQVNEGADMESAYGHDDEDTSSNCWETSKGDRADESTSYDEETKPDESELVKVKLPNYVFEDMVVANVQEEQRMEQAEPTLRGLHMPVIGEPDLVDQEYAEDALLFLLFTYGVLDTIRCAWMFSVSPVARASTRTNLMVFWQGQLTFPLGVRGTWLRLGETCRYLGCQIGLEVFPEQQFSLVMQFMRRNLCYWLSQHLSIVGRALIANQVLLASAWDVASWWTLHGGVMAKLRRLIRSFLFGGSDGTRDTRAKVHWSTVILPTSEGGFNIIDGELQNRALLTKFIVGDSRKLILGFKYHFDDIIDKESAENHLSITWDPAIFCCLLECFYSGNLHIPSDMECFLESILFFGVEMALISLIEVIGREELVKWAPTLWNLAKVLGQCSVAEACIKAFAISFEEEMEKRNFQNLTASFFAACMEYKELTVTSEQSLCKAIINWISGKKRMEACSIKTPTHCNGPLSKTFNIKHFVDSSLHYQEDCFIDSDETVHNIFHQVAVFV